MRHADDGEGGNRESVITNLLGHGQSLGVRDWAEFLLLQLVYGVFVISQIQLGANQNDGGAGTMVSHLGVPLQTHKRASRKKEGVSSSAQILNIHLSLETCRTLSVWGNSQKMR